MRKNIRRCWIWAVAALLVLSTLTPAIGRSLAFAQGNLAPWSVLCASPVSPALRHHRRHWPPTSIFCT
jgi:hypothetical protein